MAIPIDNKQLTGINLVTIDIIIPVYIAGFLVKVVKTYFSAQNNINNVIPKINTNKGIPALIIMQIKMKFKTNANLLSIKNNKGVFFSMYAFIVVAPAAAEFLRHL